MYRNPLFTLAILTVISSSPALARGSAQYDNLVQVGRNQLAQHYYSEAGNTLAQAIAIKGDDKNLRFDFANALSKAGDNDRALLEYFEVLKLAGNDHMLAARTRSQIGLNLMQRGSYDEAAGQFRQVLSQAPHDWAVRNKLGYCLSELNFFDAAKEEFALVLKEEPHNIDATYYTGEALLKQKSYGEALKYFERSVRYSDKDQRSQARSYVGISKSLTGEGQFKLAAQFAEKSLAMEPKSAKAALALGDALDKAGQKQESMAAFRQAIQIAPRDPECQAALGRLLSGQTAARVDTQLTR